MDQLLFEQSNESQITSEPFVSRQVVYVIDQNNGSYAGNQIQLDTSSLSNSGKYASYSEAYLQVPLIVSMYNSGANVAGFGNAAAQFAVGLKNGYYQLIHSVSVEYNNTGVIQLTPFTNMYVNYKLLTSLSKQDVEKYGQGIGFWPDSPLSFTYSNAASATGRGSSNNYVFGWESLYASNVGRIFADTAVATIAGGVGNAVIASNTSAAGAPLAGIYTTSQGRPPAGGWAQQTANFGLYKRMQYNAFGYTNAGGFYSTFLTENNARLLNKNYYYSNGDDQGYKAWYITAKIRLKDMSDFFDKLPLVKGAYLRFIINLNTSEQSITVAARAAAANSPVASTLALANTRLANGTNPLMIASSEVGQGFDDIPVDGSPYTIRCDIGRVTIPTNAGQVNLTHPLQSSRLYVPLYQLNPVQEEQYLSLNRTKKVVYRDIYQYSVNNIGAGDQFNSLLTNGIPNPKTIIVIPIFNATANGGLGISPIASPFASEPGTSSPLVPIMNFNVQVAGVNMFIQNQQYDFEQFTNELSAQNAINGGLVDGLVSGLIGEVEFGTNFRYYVCDVSRRLPAEDAVPKSIQILGQNMSAFAVDLYVFVEFEKSITLDLVTGAKVE